jgi:hypothetical protein
MPPVCVNGRLPTDGILIHSSFMFLRSVKQQGRVTPAEPVSTDESDPLNHTNGHEILLVLFRVISWIVASAHRTFFSETVSVILPSKNVCRSREKRYEQGKLREAIENEAG